MNSARQSIQTFLREEHGASSSEYAILIAFILVVAVASVSFLGDRVSSLFAEGGDGWQRSEGWRRVLVPDENQPFARSQ
ncbi:MAG: Flp family type IVb pilin [Phycisphaerales bacterium]|nr:Flp family type IVb pilin [Phycisphaerales bacterium]